MIVDDLFAYGAQNSAGKNVRSAPRLWLLALIALSSLSATTARAGLCDGTHPVLQHFNVDQTSGTGTLSGKLFWSYAGPDGCRDTYNVRGGIVGRALDQFEADQGLKCTTPTVPGFCIANVKLIRDKPYVYSVQACHKRFLQSSECSQWSNAQFFLPHGGDTCKDGFVWREAVANDHVCVSPRYANRCRGR
jgi:hypothetical protein